MGVLAALIGVSLVGASWVVELTASSAPALFAVSIAFGLTQEPITRILEGKLTTKPTEAPSTNAVASRDGAQARPGLVSWPGRTRTA